MDIYNQIALWTGWPPIVAFLIVLGGIGIWFFTKELRIQEKKNEILTIQLQDARNNNPDILIDRLSKRHKVLMEQIELLSNQNEQDKLKISELEIVLEKVEEEAKQTAVNVIDLEANSTEGLPRPSIAWGKVATLFWLGNDLMWIHDMMFRDASPERVIQGVNIAQTYLEELGFDRNSFPCKQLELSTVILKSLQGPSGETINFGNLLKQHYGTVDQYITTVKWYLSALVEQQEPGFTKLRAL